MRKRFVKGFIKDGEIMKVRKSLYFNGAPSRTRTCDLLLRRYYNISYISICYTNKIKDFIKGEKHSVIHNFILKIFPPDKAVGVGK